MILYLSISAAICSVGLLILLLRVPILGRPRLPYVRRKGMFTATERAFLNSMDAAIGQECMIFGKVRVADVITVRAGVGRGAWRRALRRLNRRKFDFVICSRSDMGVLCAVHLDQRFHKKKSGKGRFLSAVCRAAGLPLVRIPGRSGYDVEELRSLFCAVLKIHLPECSLPETTTSLHQPSMAGG